MAGVARAIMGQIIGSSHEPLIEDDKLGSGPWLAGLPDITPPPGPVNVIPPPNVEIPLCLRIDSLPALLA